MLTVKIRGHDVQNALLAEMSSRALEPLAEKAVAAAVHVLAEEVRARAPVDTGALRDSVREVVTHGKNGRVSGKVLVGDPAGTTFYAIFVEFGTTRQPAQPFLRPAILAAGDRAKQAAGDVLLEAWGK